ncbi:hypothetical protein GF1_19780 [Desulfolithobacter dissulfuricans]|uniref:Uncharacterized protein n=1 Tax=Desulfolithobacter dissulfuricans TaxID=2795293 RepID=A0A915U2Y5_9BACT|nr:hypothetical protein [Desulfolithobacter dissulfuricans]BCO09602.1 hypothetical protein GF1_19780 [Desulfolithobacter dissulfuricans]
MAKTANVKTRTQTGVQAKDITPASEISKVGVYAVGIGAALIGLWGLACFIGGMISAGGPLALIGSWFKAVSGM